MHHGVDSVDDLCDPARLTVSPDHLRSQLRLLQRLGLRFETVEQLIAGGGRRRRAAVTFDDGLRNNLTVATPLLQELNIRATFYVCPGLWGEQHEDISGPAGRLLTEDEAAAMHSEGMELGAHSLTHRDLRGLGDEELRRDLAACKEQIEAITGAPCRTLAYPFGLYDSRVERAAAQAGYEVALRWNPGPWRPYALPRLPGPPRHGGGRLALKLLGVRRRGR